MTSVLLAPERKIFTVSELNREVRMLLEGSFALIWLEGEVSNLSRPASGHLYFSLKDAQAQIRCALFRNRSRLISTDLANGQQVLVRARLSLYEPRGDYQLIVEHLEDAGEGMLRRAFEALRQRLSAEGLFAVERKRAIPVFPARVGVITSPSGAAVRDVLSVLARRFPGLPVLIYPVPVQGAGAGAQIAGAIGLAAQRQDCDVLLLVRGGGSLEDLWSFNEEVVVRAIADCNIPLVCGVGHETDVTIADFVADVRAPTPSAAAELIRPDRYEWQRKFQLLEQRLSYAARRRLQNYRQTLDWLLQNLLRQQPGQRLRQQHQQLAELERRLRRSMLLQLERERNDLVRLTSRLAAVNPLPRIRQLQQQRRALAERLALSMRYQLERQRRQLASLSRSLHDLSPLQTLGRGYAIVREAGSGRVVRTTDQVQAGDNVEALLARGRLICRVEETREE
jgi:exodeoxyribonuclease VII large subunit